MKLVEEIIEILSSDKPNITNALIKTKVLLFRLGEKNLTEWVNNELNGYKVKDDIPAYRITATFVEANSMSDFQSIKNHEVPTYHLGDQLRNSLETLKVEISIAALEELIRADTESRGIKIKVPIILYGRLSEKLANGYMIQDAWKSATKNFLIQIITEVRSRLLDFILELENQIPSDLKDSDLKDIAKNLDTKALFNHTIIGDNATIQLGNNNSQIVTNTIVKNDFDSLAKFFEEKNITPEDIKTLKKAIDDDQGSINHNDQQFGPNVKIWIQTMMSKALETTWQIEIGVVSSLLATGLNSFYGWF